MGYEYVIAPQKGDLIAGGHFVWCVDAYAPQANAWRIRATKDDSPDTRETHVRRERNRWVEVYLP
jgi:hypothetical protein